MDTFGSVLFTGGVVLALSSFFTHVFDILKERTRGEINNADNKQGNLFDLVLNTTSMEVLIGDQPF